MTIFNVILTSCKDGDVNTELMSFSDYVLACGFLKKDFEDVKFGFEATNVAYRISSVTEVTSGVEQFEVESAELNYWYRCEVVPCILDNDVV